MTKIANDKILILDGAMGTMLQKYGLTEEDFRRKDIHCMSMSGNSRELKGNNECLNLTRPDIIKAVHKEYIAAGADIIETNTFSANRISQAEYGCEDIAAQMAFEGARIARMAADEASETAAGIGLSRKVWVAGSIGPTSKSLSLSPDVSDPSFRPYSFIDMKEAYKEQVEALIEGGVDLLLIETCFDALNVKAVLAAIQDIAAESPTFSVNETMPPVMISVSVGDRSGRTLTGQTIEAFYTAVSHYPLFSFGLNCSLGAGELTPLIEDISKWCRSRISCYPNAGLPNEMGGYDQSPEEMALQIKAMAENGIVNIVGGCCGTTPAHIKAIADAVRDIRPQLAEAGPGRQTESSTLKVSGLEAVTIDTIKKNFTNIGERTNVAGSRKFARLISEGKYDEALQIAARQIEDGASIIDINMDDAMLDNSKEMERFIRYISNDPAVSKAALMIDSSHWDTILAGLENAQGKCIVNSISLKEGEDEFVRKAKVIKSLGAAMVIMAFDEQGQATTYDRKIQICERAYRLLTEKAEVSPEDIIFDVNILSIGTGIEEHARYAVDFIEAIRWIKGNLPGALTSGGVSNLSFAFRGNNAVREAMHSAFLYHAIKAGLDMAIVNPSMLQVYDDIDPELLRCVEDVIFDRDSNATERLIAKASRMLEEKHGSDSTTDGASGIQRDTSDSTSVNEYLRSAIVKGRSDDLQRDIERALSETMTATEIIAGPLMEGMEAVGKMFGEGKMFLPQVVKSAKVMRDAVTLLEPHIAQTAEHSEQSHRRPVVVLATVKGDVHDIGKNITGIVLTCNGFDIHDLGVMVDKETIIDTAERLDADMIAVSGLITPSLYQMEELCKAMNAKHMTTPLFIGGATTSSVHTAVKLAPLYDHVFYGADASAAAVLAKKCMLDREAFETEQHAEQQKIRELYYREEASENVEYADERMVLAESAPESEVLDTPEDIMLKSICLDDIMPYFDWKMFYAIWGVKYGSQAPEAMELIQLRQDAEAELEMRNFQIVLTARFFQAHTDGKDILFNADATEHRIPMMRQENAHGMSLCDFLPENGKAPFGMFAISVHQGKHHEEGCSCPACSHRYEDLVGKTVRMTVAEAASKWLNHEILENLEDIMAEDGREFKIIKPAAGYASCPDHTLKRDILGYVGKGLGISLTESYAMTPESSICGMIFIHPDARYPEIRRISREQYEDYAKRRGMDEATARRFLSHLLK